MKNTLSPYSIIRISIAIILLGSALLATASTQLSERDSVRTINSAVQVVTALDRDRSEKFIDDINSLSERTGTTTVVDITNFGVRTLYVSEGGQGKRWLQDGYQSFSPSLKYHVQPLSELPRLDVRQTYDTSGGGKYISQIRELAESYGAETAPIYNKEFEFLSATPIIVGFPLIAFVSAALLIYAAGFNRRRYSILKLNGKSAMEIFIMDIRAGLVPRLPHFLSLLVIGWGLLSLWTSYDGTLLFGRYFLIFVTVMMVMLTSVWFLAVLIFARTNVIESLAGKVSPSRAVSSSLLIRTVAGGLLVAATVSFWNHYPELQRQEKMSVGLERLGDIHRLSINGARTNEDLERSAHLFTESVNGLLNQGKALEYRRFHVESGEMVVSMNRSAVNILLSESGRRALDDIPQTSGVLLYSESKHSVEEPAGISIDHLGVDYYIDQNLCEVRNCLTVPVSSPYDVVNPVVQNGWWQPDPVTDRPLVLVVPDDFRPELDSDTLALLSSGNILFRDEAAAYEFQKSPEIESAVFHQRPVRSYWEERHSSFRTIVGVDMISIVLATVAVLGLAATFGYVCYLSWYQKFRSGYIFGIGPIRRFRTVIIMEFAISIFTISLIGKIYYSYWKSVDYIPGISQEMMHTISGMALIFICGTLILSGAIVMTAVSVLSRKIQQSRAL